MFLMQRCWPTGRKKKKKKKNSKWISGTRTLEHGIHLIVGSGIWYSTSESRIEKEEFGIPPRNRESKKRNTEFRPTSFWIRVSRLRVRVPDHYIFSTFFFFVRAQDRGIPNSAPLDCEHAVLDGIPNSLMFDYFFFLHCRKFYQAHALRELTIPNAL